MQNVMQQQIAYYRARAGEYDEWFYRLGRYDHGEGLNQRWFHEVAIVRAALHALNPVAEVLELACGTGIWTQELLQLGQRIVAIDAATEVIEINRQKLKQQSLDITRIEYQQLDLFQWQPNREFDLVFFAFWLSHVPPDLLDNFLRNVYQALRPGGTLFLVDSRFELTSTAINHRLKDDGSIYKTRRLNDGQEFQIVKIFYQPIMLQETLNRIGFETEVNTTERYFIYVKATKTESWRK